MYKDKTLLDQERTPFQVDETSRSILNDFVKEQLINIFGVSVVFMLCFSFETSITPSFFAILFTFLVMRCVSGWLRYCDALDMNRESLGAKKLKWNNRLTEFAEEMCAHSNIYDLPTLVSSGSDYSADYDPNKKEIRVGTPIMHYETSSSFAVVAHETGHHIQFSDPHSARGAVFIVRLARALRWTAAIVVAVSLIMRLTGSDSFGIALLTASVLYTVNFICQVIYENDATHRALVFMFDSEAAKQFVQKRHRPRKALLLSLWTYYTEAIGWVVITGLLIAALHVQGILF